MVVTLCGGAEHRVELVKRAARLVVLRHGGGGGGGGGGGLIGGGGGGSGRSGGHDSAELRVKLDQVWRRW